MRDFSDADSEPIPVPYPGQWYTNYPEGYIPTNVSICRNTSVSTSVIQGILGDEDPGLTTLWTILGNPAASIALPFWPVGGTPSLVNGSATAPLCDLSRTIYDSLYDCTVCGYCIDTYKLIDEDGQGLWPCFFSEEDIIMDSALSQMETWRAMGELPVDEMLAAELTFSEMAYGYMEACFTGTVVVEDITLTKPIHVYPNPAHSSATIEVNSILSASELEFRLFDHLGREVLNSKFKERYVFERQGLADGIYIWRASGKNGVYSGKLVLD
jgi:hypothetical protein